MLHARDGQVGGHSNQISLATWGCSRHIGDVINREHHGKHWGGPLAVVYTHPNTLGERGVPIHLAVGYELVPDLLLLALLLRLYGRLPRPGMKSWVLVLGYSAIRSVAGFVRQDKGLIHGSGVQLPHQLLV